MALPIEQTAPAPVTLPAKRENKPRENTWTSGNIPLYAALFGLSALFTLPFAWLVMTSLKPPDEVFAANFFPSRVQYVNYSDVFDKAPVYKWLINSTIVSVLAVISVLLSSSLVAYGFARIRFRGKTQLFALVMATYMLPG